MANCRNEDWRFAAGLQFDVFSPGITDGAAIFFLSAPRETAGNSFRGQLRLERFLHPADDVQWTLQAALSEPIVTTIDPVFGVSEDNGLAQRRGTYRTGTGLH